MPHSWSTEMSFFSVAGFWCSSVSEAATYEYKYVWCRVQCPIWIIPCSESRLKCFDVYWWGEEGGGGWRLDTNDATDGGRSYVILVMLCLSLHTFLQDPLLSTGLTNGTGDDLLWCLEVLESHCVGCVTPRDRSPQQDLLHISSSLSRWSIQVSVVIKKGSHQSGEIMEIFRISAQSECPSPADSWRGQTFKNIFMSSSKMKLLQNSQH